jgi:hypothetical protein
MKAICFGVMFLAISSSSSSIAFGQADYRLEFYGDEALSSCELAMTTPGIVKVHMLVTGTGNLAFIQFKAPKTACMGSAVWITDAWQQPPMRAYDGNTQGTVGQGVDVIFECHPLPVYIGSIWYSISEPAQSCCRYEPLPGSRHGEITFPGYMTIGLWSHCAEVPHPDLTQAPMSGKGIVINPNETCVCSGPLPTQQSTWGSVKALYR